MSKRTIITRAQELLMVARKLAETPGLTWVEANNVVYGPGGPFTRLFPKASDRVAFAKTAESRQVDKLIDGMPEPLVGPQRREYSGKFNVRIPKSLHAALASEAEAEGVSLNQLVLAKLALHLAGSRGSISNE
jgi:predicted HicB family RNase H-like nuclease